LHSSKTFASSPASGYRSVKNLNVQSTLGTARKQTGTDAGLPTIWPSGDALDRRLFEIALPVVANFAIGPLIGAVDLFWVNQMGNALAVAGQAAANQVFGSVFWLTAFLPSVTATLISKENAKGNKQGVQEAVSQALFVGSVLAAVSTAVLLSNPDKVLRSVFKDGSPALEYARPYLVIRAFSFLPSLISLVGFSVFRGVMDTLTPVKISLLANLFHAILDPFLIFTLKLGVPGAAIATLVSEIVSAVSYLVLMKKHGMLRSIRVLFRPPPWHKLEGLLKGGSALQVRNMALNLTFLAVARAVQSIDQTGTAAAAHALSLQTFQLGGIVLLALSTVSQTMVPTALYEGGKRRARATANRLLSWGFLLGIAFGVVQVACLPLIQRSSPLQHVRDAARVPALLASVLQSINGLVFVGEGIMTGTGSFLQLSATTALATVGCLLALGVFPSRFGLTGVWLAFGVFNAMRLLGVGLHHSINGPLAPKNL